MLMSTAANCADRSESVALAAMRLLEGALVTGSYGVDKKSSITWQTLRSITDETEDLAIGMLNCPARVRYDGGSRLHVAYAYGRKWANASSQRGRERSRTEPQEQPRVHARCH